MSIKQPNPSPKTKDGIPISREKRPFPPSNLTSPSSISSLNGQFLYNDFQNQAKQYKSLYMNLLKEHKELLEAHQDLLKKYTSTVINSI